MSQHKNLWTVEWPFNRVGPPVIYTEDLGCSIDTKASSFPVESMPNFAPPKKSAQAGCINRLTTDKPKQRTKQKKIDYFFET